MKIGDWRTRSVLDDMQVSRKRPVQSCRESSEQGGDYSHTLHVMFSSTLTPPTYSPRFFLALSHYIVYAAINSISIKYYFE